MDVSWAKHKAVLYNSCAYVIKRCANFNCISHLSFLSHLTPNSSQIHIILIYDEIQEKIFLEFKSKLYTNSDQIHKGSNLN